MPNYAYSSAQEFVAQMDLGVFDGTVRLAAEIKKLSSAQLKEITEILLLRSPFRAENLEHPPSLSLLLR